MSGKITYILATQFLKVALFWCSSCFCIHT